MELPNRAKLEAKFGRRIQQLNNRHKRELIALLGVPPDVNNVTEEFWAKVRRENEEETAALLLLLFMDSAMLHVKKGGGSVSQSEDILMSQGETFAAERAASIGIRQSETARTRLETLSRKIEEQDSEFGKAETLKKADPIFSPSESIKISRDETTRARHEGGETGVLVTTGFSEDDIWINRPSLSRTGPCPICAPLDKKPRSVWARQFPQGPPTPHPGCVCVIEYAFERESQ